MKDELVKLHKLASRILPNGQLDLLIIILHEKSALYGNYYYLNKIVLYTSVVVQIWYKINVFIF